MSITFREANYIYQNDERMYNIAMYYHAHYTTVLSDPVVDWFSELEVYEERCGLRDKIPELVDYAHQCLESKVNRWKELLDSNIIKFTTTSLSIPRDYDKDYADVSSYFKKVLGVDNPIAKPSRGSCIYKSAGLVLCWFMLCYRFNQRLNNNIALQSLDMLYSAFLSEYDDLFNGAEYHNLMVSGEEYRNLIKIADSFIRGCEAEKCNTTNDVFFRRDISKDCKRI